MSYNLTEFQLLEKFQNTDFVLKTQAQITKDFQRSGHEIQLPVDRALSLEDLTDFVGEALARVLKTGETNTLQLLYQIDIPQQQFLSLTTDPDFVTKAASLIIRREAQKVYLRSTL